MSKLKATQRGKAGKHKGQDNFDCWYVRGLRIARVRSSVALRILDRIRRGSSDEPDGALAGSRLVKLSASA